jgi:lipopolysaccharide export LptBFGC system permease protein LptF
MKTKRVEKILELLIVLVMCVFATPFAGGYFLMDRKMETKIVGAILLVVGVVIWFVCALHY